MRILFVVFILQILLPRSIFAEDASIADYLIEEAETLDLASHPTWRKLLHFSGTRNHSEIKSDSFFLSPDGKRDPKAELEATIRAYFQEEGENKDEHPRCRFPARYYWLSQHLALPGYSLENLDCGNFRKWALLKEVKSVSLYLVSGYFGNPASTFGHSLLKLNTESQDDQLGLFDLTINYGALVPENENTAIYVIRGLTGGYEAGFSDQYFYTQDQVYTRTEFRDIWDFELELDEAQRTLLLLHLWEIIGKKFTYYFLKENCAYRLAELLELVVDEKLLKNARAWYIPVEMFNRLQDIDEARKAKNETGIIRSISPLPSSRRLLYAQLSCLDQASLTTVNRIIAQGPILDLSPLRELSTSQQIDSLDALLAYQQYKQISEGAQPSPERQQAKDKILLERLQLPIRTTPPIEPELPTSPTQSTHPMLTGVGIGSDRDGSLFPRFNWAAFSQESLSPNALEGSELVALSASLGVIDEKPVFDRFDFIRITKLNTTPLVIAGENRRSWQLRIGMDRTITDAEPAHDWTSSFGLGRAWQLNESSNLSAMANVAYHSQGQDLRFRPEIALSTRLSKLRASLRLGIENDEDDRFHETWGGALQYHFTAQRALRLDFNNEFATRASLSVLLYW